MKVQHAAGRLASIGAGSSATVTINVKPSQIDAIHVAARDGAGAVIDRQLYRVAVRDVQSTVIPRTGTAISADLICPDGRQSSAFGSLELAGGGDVEVTIYADVAIATADVALVSLG